MIDKIGIFGPFILIFTNIYFLKKRDVVYYILFAALSSLVNFIVKSITKQPRPRETMHTTRFILKNGLLYDVYGMPSAHAQSVVFSTVYYYLVMNRGFLFFFIGISMITLIERVHDQHHTVMQVSVGAILGGLIALVAVYIKYLNIDLNINYM
jgi:membrane-associated phospholipid phosphatase